MSSLARDMYFHKEDAEYRMQKPWKGYPAWIDIPCSQIRYHLVVFAGTPGISTDLQPGKLHSEEPLPGLNHRPAFLYQLQQYCLSRHEGWYIHPDHPVRIGLFQL